MDLNDYARVLRRRWPILAIAVIVALALAWVSSPAPKARAASEKSDATYRARHTLLIDPEIARGNGLGRIVLFATSGTVPERATRALDGKEGTHRTASGQAGAQRRSVGKQGQVWLGDTTVTVAPNPTDASIVITAIDRDPERAIAAANTLARELVRWNQKSEESAYQSQLSSARTRRQALEDRIAVITFEMATASPVQEDVLVADLRAVTSELSSVEQEIIRLEQVGPPARSISTLESAGYAEVVEEKGGTLFSAPTARTPRLAIAGLLGLLLGVGVVLLLERFDTSVGGARAVESIAALPVIAEVPYARAVRGANRVALIDDPTSRVAEAYRGLRTSISLMWLAGGRDTDVAESGAAAIDVRADHTGAGLTEPRVILVTSPGANEGKSATASNVAAAIAETGRSVILLDLDFRRPQIHRYFDGGRSPGLGDLEGPDTDLDEVLQPTAQDGLRFAAAMAAETPPAVAVTRARVAIEAASQLADVVVLDTPPLLLANDTYDLMVDADAIVLVVREGRTDREALRRASDLLMRIATPIVGITLIAAPRTLGNASYAHGKRYGPPAESQGRRRVRDLLGRTRRESPSSESDDLIRLS